MSDTTRQDFEAKFSGPPYHEDLRRFPDHEDQSWPGQYRDINVQRAWESWTASRLKALQEAAKKCDRIANSEYPGDAEDCALAIRTLAGTTKDGES